MYKKKGREEKETVPPMASMGNLMSRKRGSKLLMLLQETSRATRDITSCELQGLRGGVVVSANERQGRVPKLGRGGPGGKNAKGQGRRRVAKRQQCDPWGGGG